MLLPTVDFFAVPKNLRGAKLAFSRLSLVLFPTKEYSIQISGECYQKCTGGGGVLPLLVKKLIVLTELFMKLEFIKILLLIVPIKESDCFLNIEM